MIKLLYVVVGVSLASITGLSGVALGGEKGVPQIGGTTWVQVAQQKNWNSSKSNTSTAVKRKGRDGDIKDIPKGSGDPMKGLLGGKGTPCKPCDVPFGGTVNTGGDQGGAAQAKDYNTTRIKGTARPVTPPRRGSTTPRR